MQNGCIGSILTATTTKSQREAEKNVESPHTCVCKFILNLLHILFMCFHSFFAGLQCFHLCIIFSLQCLIVDAANLYLLSLSLRNICVRHLTQPKFTRFQRFANKCEIKWILTIYLLLASTFSLHNSPIHFCAKRRKEYGSSATTIKLFANNFSYIR